MATTKTETKKPSLSQKLLEIQKKVVGLGKDSQSHGYKYVSGDKALSYIKPLMNDLGLLLVPEVTEWTNDRIDYKTRNGEKSEILSKLSMTMTWVDTESGEERKCFWGANGQNDFEKGFGSALTYAERYFLLKFFHIATDEDDIDNPHRKPHEPTTPPKQPAKPTTKAKLSDLSKVKESLKKDREATIALLNEKYELTQEQRKELGL
jgi:hypothetical protein